MKFTCFIISFILISFLCNAQQPDNSKTQTDNEVWMELGVVKHFNKHFSAGVLLNSLNKLGDSFHNYDNFVEGAIKYQLGQAIAIEGLYRQEYSTTIEGTQEVERRPQIRGSYSFKLGNWSFRNRHRYEWRFIDDHAMKNRYRTDFRVKPPVKFSPLELVPYFQPEMFFSNQTFNRSRCYLGFAGQIKSLFPSFYLVRQSDRKTNNWVQKYAVGFALDFIL